MTHWEARFRENMKRHREWIELTQTEFARMMKARGFAFHQQTVQRIESGERPIRLDEAFAIAELLGATVVGMARDTAPGLGDLVNAVDRITRRSRIMVNQLDELFYDWHDMYEELYMAFKDVLDAAGGEPTSNVRVAAAWVIKANWVYASLHDLMRSLSGVGAEDGRDWHETAVPRETQGDLDWLEDESADIWTSVPDAERPAALADLAPDELIRRLDRSFIEEVRSGEVKRGEHPEAS